MPLLIDGVSAFMFSFYSFGLVQSAGSSHPLSPSETNAGEIYFVELVKEDGTLGFSVTVRVVRRAWKANVEMMAIWRASMHMATFDNVLMVHKHVHHH